VALHSDAKATMGLDQHDQAPLNRCQLFRMYVVIPRWQQFGFLGDYLCSANLAPIDAGIGCAFVRTVEQIKRAMIRVVQILLVLIESHRFLIHRRERRAYSSATQRAAAAKAGTVHERNRQAKLVDSLAKCGIARRPAARGPGNDAAHAIDVPRGLTDSVKDFIRVPLVRSSDCSITISGGRISIWTERFRAEKQRRIAEVLATLKSRATAPAQLGPSLPPKCYAGRYWDPWYGDIEVTQSGDGLRIDSSQFPGMAGTLEHWQ